MQLVLELLAPLEIEERHEERELEDEREAGAQRIEVVLLVELHELLLHPLLVFLVALLDLLHLWLEQLERLHRADLLEGQRQDQKADHARESDYRPAPAQADVVVEE